MEWDGLTEQDATQQILLRVQEAERTARLGDLETAIGILKGAQRLDHNADPSLQPFCEARVHEWEEERLQRAKADSPALTIGTRLDRIRHLEAAADCYTKSAHLAQSVRERKERARRALRCQSKMLIIDGIRLVQDLDIANAKDRFQRSWVLRQQIGDSDEVRWVEAAIVQADALLASRELKEVLPAIDDSEIRKRAAGIASAYQRASALLGSMSRQDVPSIQFCESLHAMFLFISDRSPGAFMRWNIASAELPARVFVSGTQRSKLLQFLRWFADLERMTEHDWKVQFVQKRAGLLERQVQDLLARLVAKIPGAAYKTNSRSMVETFGDCLRQFESYLSVPAPELVDLFNKVWKTFVKHAESARKSASPSDLDRLVVSFCDDRFQKAVDRYLKEVNSAILTPSRYDVLQGRQARHRPY